MALQNSARVPLRIYRIDSSSNTVSAVATVERNFLEGVTVDDIFVYDSFRSLQYNLENYDVEVDEDGYDYIIVANQKRFIPKTINDIVDQLPVVFEFYLNPKHISPQYQKLNTEIRTRGGWEIQHWGDQLTQLQISGRTGSLLTRESPSDPKSREDPDFLVKSAAWQKLAQLRQLYSLDYAQINVEQKYKIGIGYYDKFYIGYFLSFSGPEADENNPYIMDYSFTLKIEKETDILSQGKFAI